MAFETRGFDQCLYCYKKTHDNKCQSCMSDFVFRPRPNELSGAQQAQELIRWKKSGIPTFHIAQRAAEFLKTSVTIKDIAFARKFRIIIRTLEKSE